MQVWCATHAGESSIIWLNTLSSLINLWDGFLEMQMEFQYIEKKTIQNLKIASIDVENNLLLIKGAIPGPTGSSVVLKPAVK